MLYLVETNIRCFKNLSYDCTSFMFMNQEVINVFHLIHNLLNMTHSQAWYLPLIIKHYFNLILQNLVS